MEVQLLLATVCPVTGYGGDIVEVQPKANILANDTSNRRLFILNFCKLGCMAYSGWHTSGPRNPLDREGGSPDANHCGLSDHREGRSGCLWRPVCQRTCTTSFCRIPDRPDGGRKEDRQRYPWRLCG